MNCKNCDTEVNQNYCPNCGQPSILKRIDGHYIQHEIEHVLHFEKGILFTIKGLLISPGNNIRYFITDNRNRLVKPIIFIIIASLVYTLLIHFFHIEDGYVKIGELKEGSTVSVLIKWITSHYGYSNIIWGVFIAFWAKVFFRKYNYNFFEILILLCFVQGMMMLIFSIFIIFQVITHLNLQKFGGQVGLIYCIWAIGHFFDKKKVSSYLKALAAYMLGTITFFILVFLIGILIDLLIKH